MKLAISYALAQSTKLSLHERRVSAMVVETKHLPESLAASGKVALSPETIAKLIGKVRRQQWLRCRMCVAAAAASGKVALSPEAIQLGSSARWVMEQKVV